jgi:selenocysteine lyase/cysteine desulfurase
MRPLPAPAEDFIGLVGRTHLASGGEPPLLASHRAAFEAFAADKADGFAGYHRHWAVVDEVRARIAHLTHATPDQVALPGNASDAIDRVVGAIDWEKGDNVIVSPHDFASGRHALGALARQGVEVRLARAEGWLIPEEAYGEAADDRTRLVYVSQVNALTGQHLRIREVDAELPDDVILLVDSSHALGVLPIDARLADFTVSCTYKFALGVYEGALIWNRARQPDFLPSGAGWWSGGTAPGPVDYAPKPDARRAEYGNAGHLGAYLLRDSLAYLESFGADRVAAHVRRLSGAMVEGFARLGLDVVTPADPASRGASAAFAHPAEAEIVRRAAAEGVLIWGDNSRIRASAHVFNTMEDVERMLEGLPRWLKDLPA